MGNQIYFKIAGYVDLAVLIIFTPVQFLTLLTVCSHDPMGQVELLLSLGVRRRRPL
jgi:hypothetical protein